MNNLFFIENIKKLPKMLPILKIQFFQKEICLIVNKTFILSSLFFIKNHINYQFKILSCVSGLDYPPNKHRFKIIYDLLSVRYNFRIRIKLLTDELTPVMSCGHIFSSACWYESEIWDMFGVFFQHHFNLMRLLTDYGFEGYPLRKDFPLSGFIETSYDYTRKRVLNKRAELSQEHRIFKFSSPWEVLELN